MKITNKNKGFTILEIMLVITLMGILIGISIVLLRPNERVAATRNIVRKTDISNIYKALEYYKVKNKGIVLNTITTNYQEICDTGTLSSTDALPNANYCNGKLDLRVLVPTYIKSIPKDSQATDTASTGYELAKTSTNQVSIMAVNSELVQFIAINPISVKNNLVLNLDAGDTSSYSGSGTNWIDLVGNDNNGTLVNGVSYNSANSGSLGFDGINDMVEGSIDGNIFTSNFTQAAWIKKSNADQPWQGIFTNSVASSFFGTNNTYLMTFGNGSPAAPLNSVGVNQVGVVADGVFLDIGTHINKWLYIVITKKGSSLNIYCYKDGSLLQSSGTISWNGGNFATTNNYQIGRHWAGGGVTPFQGNIAQISVYNRALTVAEIQQNYNETKVRFEL